MNRAPLFEDELNAAFRRLRDDQRTPRGYYQLATRLIREDKRRGRRWGQEREWQTIKDVIADGAVHFYDTKLKSSYGLMQRGEIDENRVGAIMALIRDQIRFWCFHEEEPRPANELPDNEMMQEIYNHVVHAVQDEYNADVYEHNQRVRSHRMASLARKKAHASRKKKSTATRKRAKQPKRKKKTA